MDSSATYEIALASPVRQDPLKLVRCLQSLQKMKVPDQCAVTFMFYDDNVNPLSSQILKAFRPDGKTVEILTFERKDEHSYNNHQWNSSAMDAVISMKNELIRLSKERKVDALFLIDSDLVLHPETLCQLWKTGKTIVSNIFWTRWSPNSRPEPQVWMFDKYEQHAWTPSDGTLSTAAVVSRTQEFHRKLNVRGTYRVGGLGACTLILKDALQRFPELSFSYLRNVSFWGEDRHFCIRAETLGFDLWVDTHFPAVHMYRDEDLKRNPQQRIAVGLVMKNEAGRFLRRMLESASEYADVFVVVDDQSTDNSVALLKEVCQERKVDLILNTDAGVNFEQEGLLRQKVWEEMCNSGADWFIFLDADEMFDSPEEIRPLLESTLADMVDHRLLDMWDENHYRSDQYWVAGLHLKPRIYRYFPSFKDLTLSDQKLHCGFVPTSVMRAPNRTTSNVRLLHYGWSTEEIRKQKVEFYKKRDPEGKYGWPEQYNSILDEEPRLRLLETKLPTRYCDYDNRFILEDDEKTRTVADTELHPWWWSRFYEYAWVMKFAGPDHDVLDAACGITHPFKWHLAKCAKSVVALDYDLRIKDLELIREATIKELGENAYVPEMLPKNLSLVYGNLISLPYADQSFDRVFCVSVIEENPTDIIQSIFNEFSRVTRPGGLVVITFDYPIRAPLMIINSAHNAGLHVRGSLNIEVPGNALHGGKGVGEGLKVFRCVFERPKH